MISDPPGVDARVPEFRFSHTVPVRFSDLDLLGHVNHIAFFDVLEQARVTYYHEVMGLGTVRDVKFVMAELHIRYLAPAMFGQAFLIRFRVTWLKRSSSGFAYEIRDRDGDQLLAAGDGVQVYMDLEANKAEPLPHAYRERVLAFEGSDLTPP
jgi:acyl-CoA thioester hydrolase